METIPFVLLPGEEVIDNLSSNNPKEKRFIYATNMRLVLEDDSVISIFNRELFRCHIFLNDIIALFQQRSFPYRSLIIGIVFFVVGILFVVLSFFFGSFNSQIAIILPALLFLKGSMSIMGDNVSSGIVPDISYIPILLRYTCLILGIMFLVAGGLFLTHFKNKRRHQLVISTRSGIWEMNLKNIPIERVHEFINNVVRIRINQK